MSKYQCLQCDYIYDEELEVLPVIELPDSYVCPKCGTNKTWLMVMKKN